MNQYVQNALLHQRLEGTLAADLCMTLLYSSHIYG